MKTTKRCAPEGIEISRFFVQRADRINNNDFYLCPIRPSSVDRLCDDEEGREDIGIPTSRLIMWTWKKTGIAISLMSIGFL